MLVDATPRDADDSLAYRLACLREQAATASAQALRVRPTARSVAWSPAGCSPAGGCLLAVTTEDGKVPPAACSHPGLNQCCWRHVVTGSVQCISCGKGRVISWVDDQLVQDGSH